MAGPQGKDYYYTIGKTYGYLTIVKPLPRERDENGYLKTPMAIVKCAVCGSTTQQKLLPILSGIKKSCGCIDYNSKRCTDLKNRAKWQARARKLDDEAALLERDEDGPPYIVAVLHAKYVCPWPEASCIRSDVARLCCWECDKRLKCKLACGVRPDKCGAKKREVEQID